MKIGARGSVESPFDKFRPSPLILIIIWFLRIAEELPLCLNITVEDSPCVLSHHIPDCVILLSEALFFRTFTWYFYCSRNQSGCGKPEPTGQMRARPHSLSLPWHGIDYKI